LIVVRAPAGYGKTSACRDWRKALIAAGLDSTWTSLAWTEGRPEKVRAALAQALQVGRDASADPDRQFARLAKQNKRLTVFLDDYQILSSEAEAAVRSLLLNRWPGLRLVIASRSEPALNVRRLRITGEAEEIGVAQLRIGELDAAARLRMAGAVVDPAVRGELLRLVDGWPAALGFAAALMADGVSDGPSLMAGLGEPGTDFGRYFEEEVLTSLADPERRFLLEAGTLVRFTADLLRAATGDADAEQLAQHTARRSGLVTFGLDGVYRLHPLAATQFSARLRLENPERARAVHQAAGAWRRDHGLYSEAVTDAFASGEISAAAALLAEASRRHQRIGRWRTFSGWTSRLPEPLLDEHPAIRLEAASAHAVLFEFSAARRHIEAVQQAARSDLEHRVELYAAEAILGAFADEPEKALTAGERGLAAGGPATPYSTGVLHTAIAIGQLHRGSLDKAKTHVLEARAVHEDGQSAFGVAFSLMLGGLCHAIGGDLGPAVTDWRNALAAVARLNNAEAMEAMAAGYLPLAFYEWGRTAEARDQLDRCLSSAVEVAVPDGMASLYVAGVRLALLQGDPDRAGQLLDEAEVTGLRRNWPRLVHVALNERVRIALAAEDHAEARRLKREHDARIGPAKPPAPSALEIDGAGLAELRFDAAIHPGREILTRLRATATRATSQNQRWRALKLTIIESKTRACLGDEPGALRLMRRAVELAAPGRLIRTFADEGGSTLALLGRIADEEASAPSSLPLAFVDEVLASGGLLRRPPEGRVAAVEPLSPREREMMQMVAAGLTNRELGRRLYVTENTVKWHLQHIFAKLGVTNRVRAIIAARDNGVID
jgi:LuxR family maltose regulon positive regulatory protein